MNTNRETFVAWWAVAIGATFVFVVAFLLLMRHVA
jgi:hypothetical protein